MLMITRRSSLSFVISKLIFLVCLAPLVTLGLYWLFGDRLPLPGTSSVVIAFTAAALSFYNGIRPWQKGVSIAVLALLLWVEFQAIKSDRAKTDAKALDDKAASNFAAAQSRSEQDKEFAALLLAQEKDFLKTESGLRDVIRNDQKHFNDTIRKVNGVLDATREVAGTSQRNLDEMLGADSVPCITPRIGEIPRGIVFLDIDVLGRNSLNGVNIVVKQLQGHSYIRIWSERLGSVSPGAPTSLSNHLDPNLPSLHNHPALYSMTITTRNGEFHEELEVNGVNDYYKYSWALGKEASLKEGDRSRRLLSQLAACKGSSFSH